MKIIPLTQGEKTFVDECDYEYLMRWKWQCACAKHQRTKYAVHSQLVGGGRWKKLHMHRLIVERMGLLIGDRQVDHIDGNGLNNCRSNLRIATQSQNRANLRHYRNNTSGYKGVTWDKYWKKWVAKIRVVGRDYSIGRFDNLHDAAKAYNEAAAEYFGEFAQLNSLR